MNTNKFVFIFLILAFFYSCGSGEKKYEDYNESDFYEVQGIVTETHSSSDPFDSSRIKTIFYDYHLEFNKPLSGSEKNIDLVLRVGDPIVVLVFKKDKKISFFARHGIVDENLEIR